MPDNNWTDKLETFSALVLHDAQEKRDEIMEQTEKEYQGRIDKKETELLEGAYKDIQKNIHETEKDVNEKILHTELEAKKKLIVKREEIIEDVMTAARERLKEFTQSADYEKWLLDKIEKAIFELGEGAKTVYISADDVKLKSKIEKLADNVTVEAAAERGFIGGVKVTNTDRRVAVDYSMGEMLSEQKTKFLRESGLTLD